MPILKSSIKHQLDFNAVSKNGKKILSHNLITILDINFANSDNSDRLDDKCFYYGLKVSKKFSKKAVIRNRVKRRIRAALDKFIDSNQNIHISGSAALFIPKKNILKCKFSNIVQDIKNTYEKVKID